MKIKLTILTLLFAITTFGQLHDSLFPKSDVYGNIITLTRIDSISQNMLIGNFHTSDGYCGNTYRFDTDFQFTKNQHCCIFDSTIDKGNWLIENGTSIFLKSKNQSVQLSMVQLNNYYFLVPRRQQQTFLNDLNKTIDRVNKKRLLKKTESVAYRCFLICTILSQNYYSSKIF